MEENPRNRSRFSSHLVLKFVLIFLLLCFLPLFPTDPPEFISHTVFAHTWELIHLFVIGIVLSYGLFCTLKTHQISRPKPQISQPYGASILRHASLFDSEDDNPNNPSGYFEENVDPTRKSCGVSYCRDEPFVVVRGENRRVVGERPLGLPVRSLRTRVWDSDSDGEDECETLRSGEVQNLEENVGGLSQIPWDYSRSMSMGVGEGFMGQSGGFRVPSEGPYQTNYGVCCSWLPESQASSMGAFEMPGSGFYSTQGYGSNLMGNLGWGEGNVYVPSTEVSSSMAAPTPTNDFVYGRYGHDRVNLGDPSMVENGDLSGERNGFFMASAGVLPSVSVPEKDFASSMKPLKSRSSRKLNNEIRDSGVSMPPSFEHGNLAGENPGFFKPSVAAAPSVSADKGFASSMEPLRSRSSRKLTNKIGDSGISPNFEHGNLAGEKASLFMPSAAVAPSVSAPEMNFASILKAKKANEFDHENQNLGTKDVPSVAIPERDLASSMKTSRSRKVGNEIGDLGLSKTFENGNLSGEKVSSFVPVSPSPVSATDKDSGSSSKGSRHVKFNDESRDSVKSPDVGSGNVVGEPSSVSPVGKDSTSSSVRKSRSRKSRQEKGDKGKSSNLQKENVRGEKMDSFTPSAAVDPSSVSAPEKGFQRIQPLTSPEKKDEGSKKDSMGNLGQVDDLSRRLVDLLSTPTPRDDIASSVPDKSSVATKDEQRSSPTKWQDDCFVAPTPENNETENTDQENVSHVIACPPEPPSSAGLRSSNEQMSPVAKMGGDVSPSSANSSDVEELEGNIDAYKPTTPSPPPPPQVQTQMNDFPSSVESSSNALGNNVDLLGGGDDDDDGELGLGLPPTPERGRALVSRSRSRRFSCSSFFDRDQRKGSKDDHAKEAANKKISKRGSSCGWDCLKLDMKPALAKAALKGKSVRTIRPGETPPNPQGETPQGEVKREERKGEKPGMVVIQIGISEKRPTSSSNGVTSGQNQGSGTTSIIVGLNPKESSKVTATDAKEEETDSDEIDRKAGEFIAKFKEQMRLQKVATARGESSRSRQQQQPQRNPAW